jgi:hypothetical protein
MIEHDRVGARPLEAHQHAPVVEDLEIAALRDEQQHPVAGPAVAVRDQRLSHVMGRDRDARAVRDLAVQIPPLAASGGESDRRGD